MAAFVVLLMFWQHRKSKQDEQISRLQTLHAEDPAPDPTNDIARLGPHEQLRKTPFEKLNDADRNALTEKFKNEFRPALEHWCNVYAGHVPFRPDGPAPENFQQRIGRGDYYYCYVFLFDGVTIGIEERNGVANVSYVNTPQTAKLMDLPKGEPPDISAPLTREEVTRLLKEDSGKDFPPSDIRMVPTAVGSAMQGGINVMVGGDSENAASWEYTLTFGRDNMLTYHLKGNYVQGKSL